MGTVEQAAAAFRTLADAEGDAVPMYARLCRIIADDPALASLLLEAPTGQRLPVLLLAALHDVVLADPATPLAAWYPSVGGDPAAAGDLAAALRSTLDRHRREVSWSLRHRRVQTNEVNRSVAWATVLTEASHLHDGRSAVLVELGASAGLNLWPDRARITFEGAAAGGGDVVAGDPGSPLELSTRVRTGTWPELGGARPEVAERVGIDSHPVELSNPEQARWLLACVWPEQQLRVRRLRAAMAAAASRPTVLRRGDVVDDLPDLLSATPDDHHVVVLSSWVLAYLERRRRGDLLDTLVAAEPALRRRGCSLSLATLEADHVLPWMPAPPLPADALPELQHASLLVVTDIGADGVHPRAIARCQAHLAWMDCLTP